MRTASISIPLFVEEGTDSVYEYDQVEVWSQGTGREIYGKFPVDPTAFGLESSTLEAVVVRAPDGYPTIYGYYTGVFGVYTVSREPSGDTEYVVEESDYSAVNIPPDWVDDDEDSVLLWTHEDGIILDGDDS